MQKSSGRSRNIISFLTPLGTNIEIYFFMEGHPTENG